MREAAAGAGFDLMPVSSFRDFERQRAIWNAKFRGERPALDKAGRRVNMGAIVMDGAVIGDEVIVGAGALVPAGKRLPPRTLWVGSPARQQRALEAKEIAFLAESAAHYVNLKNDYLKK